MLTKPHAAALTNWPAYRETDKHYGCIDTNITGQYTEQNKVQTDAQSSIAHTDTSNKLSVGYLQNNFNSPTYDFSSMISQIEPTLPSPNYSINNSYCINSLTNVETYPNSIIQNVTRYNFAKAPPMYTEICIKPQFTYPIQ